MQLSIQFDSTLEMNVYIYGGKSRLDSTQSVVDGNAKVKVGETYSIPAEEGFLVVAYPSEMDSTKTNTEVKFSYWAEEKPLPPEPVPDQPITPDTDNNSTSNTTYTD